MFSDTKVGNIGCTRGANLCGLCRIDARVGSPRWFSCFSCPLLNTVDISIKMLQPGSLVTSLLSTSCQICLTEPIWHRIHSSVHGNAIMCQTLKSLGHSGQSPSDRHCTVLSSRFSSCQAHQSFSAFSECQLNVVKIFFMRNFSGNSCLEKMHPKTFPPIIQSEIKYAKNICLKYIESNFYSSRTYGWVTSVNRLHVVLKVHYPFQKSNLLVVRKCWVIF